MTHKSDLYDAAYAAGFQAAHNALHPRVAELEAAIREHHARMNEHYELMPGPDDQKLYAVLKGTDLDV